MRRLPQIIVALMAIEMFLLFVLLLPAECGRSHEFMLAYLSVVFAASLANQGMIMTNKALVEKLGEKFCDAVDRFRLGGDNTWLSFLFRFFGSFTALAAALVVMACVALFAWPILLVAREFGRLYHRGTPATMAV